MNKSNFLNNFYENTLNKIEAYSKTKYSLIILAIISFSESSFFIIPPDFLLLAMVYALPSRAFLFAFVCSLSSALGGLFGYLIGYIFYNQVEAFIVQHNYMHYVEYFKNLYNSYGNLATFIAGFTPIPYKIATILSGFLKANIISFTAISIIARFLRYFLLAYLCFILHKYGSNYIKKYFATIMKYSIIISLIIIIIIMLIN